MKRRRIGEWGSQPGRALPVNRFHFILLRDFQRQFSELSWSNSDAHAPISCHAHTDTGTHTHTQTHIHIDKAPTVAPRSRSASGCFMIYCLDTMCSLATLLSAPLLAPLFALLQLPPPLYNPSLSPCSTFIFRQRIVCWTDTHKNYSTSLCRICPPPPLAPPAALGICSPAPDPLAHSLAINTSFMMDNKWLHSR